MLLPTSHKPAIDYFLQLVAHAPGIQNDVMIFNFCIWNIVTSFGYICVCIYYRTL